MLEKQEQNYRLWDIAFHKDAKILSHSNMVVNYSEGFWDKTRTHTQYIVYLNGRLLDINRKEWNGHNRIEGKISNETEDLVKVFDKSGFFGTAKTSNIHKIEWSKFASMAMYVRHLWQRIAHVEGAKILFAYKLMSQYPVVAGKDQQSFIVGDDTRSVMVSTMGRTGYIRRRGTDVPLSEREYEIIYPLMSGAAYAHAIATMNKPVR